MMKTFYAAEVLGEAGNGIPKYVGAGGRLTITPHFFSSVKTLRWYLTRVSWMRKNMYNPAKMGDRTRIVVIEKQDMLHLAAMKIMSRAEFDAIGTRQKTATYNTNATFRLRLADGSWVNTSGNSAKFGKVWTAPGFLRRHLGDRLRQLQSGRYLNAVVHVTEYDKEGIEVLRNSQVPVLQFLLQSPIYQKRWEEIHTPSTISAGDLRGRLANNQFVV